MKSERKTPAALNIFLWVAQFVIASVLIFSAYVKIFQPADLVVPWIEENPNLGFFMGIVDIAGGIGILFPALFKIRPKLSIYAAICIVVLMVSAIIFHLLRGEGGHIGINLLIFVLAIAVAWGRGSRVAVMPKTDLHIAS